MHGYHGGAAGVRQRQDQNPGGAFPCGLCRRRSTHGRVR